MPLSLGEFAATEIIYEFGRPDPLPIEQSFEFRRTFERRPITAHPVLENVDVAAVCALRAKPSLRMCLLAVLQ